MCVQLPEGGEKRGGHLLLIRVVFREPGRCVQIVLSGRQRDLPSAGGGESQNAQEFALMGKIAKN